MIFRILKFQNCYSKYNQSSAVLTNFARNFPENNYMYSSFYSPTKYGRAQIQMPKKWPEDIELVIKSPHPNKGSVYVSNIEAAQNLQTLKKRGIKAILSCAKGYKVSHPISQIPHYKYVATQDKQSYDLTPHFQECADFIRNAIEQTNILVHCIAGVSRSVSMVIAYLIKHQGMGYEEAFYLIKARRKIISPNQGFIVQLKKYHAKLKGKQYNPSPHKIKQKEEVFIRGRQKPQTTSQPFIAYKSEQKDKKSDLTRANVQYNEYSKKFDEFNRTNTYDLGGNNYVDGYGVSRPLSKQFQRYYRGDVHPKSMNKIDYQYKQAKKQQQKQKYSQFTYSKNINNIEVQTPIKKRYDLENDNKLTRTSTTNEKYNTIAEYRTPDRKGYFDAMNSELNQKIQAIRQKYEKQRQDLVNNSAMTVSTGKYASNNSEKRYLNQSTIISSVDKLQQNPVVSQATRVRGYSAKIPSRISYDQKRQRHDQTKDVHIRYQEFLRNKFQSNDHHRKYDARGRNNQYYGYSRRPLYNF